MNNRRNMGLDMYALTTRRKLRKYVDFDVDDEDCELLHTWRKHPNLHGMMRAFYELRGGENTDFNCSNLRLGQIELSELEAAIIDGTLPTTHGVFFGESDGSEKEDDLVFIAKARNAMQSGLTVFYRAWW